MIPDGAQGITVTLVTLLSTTLMLVSGGTASAGPLDPSYREDRKPVHTIFEWLSSG